MQKIHEGHIIQPDEFFVSTEDYEVLKNFTPKIGSMKFDLNSFDYRKLEKIYKQKFKTVFLLPLDFLKCPKVWSKILGVNLEHQRIDAFPNKTSNKSFSQFAVKLTFYRYYFFRILGARPINSNDSEYLIPRMYPQTPRKFNSLTLSQKAFETPRRLKLKFSRNWKWWMQKIIDKVVPYKKYRIDFDNINVPSQMDANKLFYEQLIADVKKSLR